jgi:hypothetical protein
MEKYLVKHNKRWYYTAIENYYKGKSAKRSKLPYMNHINEGIVILKLLHAPDSAIEAFCLHPLFQGDNELATYHEDKELNFLMGPKLMKLVIEYRNVANNFLAPHYGKKEPKLSPIIEVNWMLLADKIQNYKDFLNHQRHPHMGLAPTMSMQKWIELDKYFQEWLRLLVPYFKFDFNKEIEMVWKVISNEKEQNNNRKWEQGIGA